MPSPDWVYKKRFLTRQKKFLMLISFYPSYAYPGEQSELLVVSSAWFLVLSWLLLPTVFCTGFTILRYTRLSNKSMQSWCCKRLRDIKCSVSFRFHKGVWNFFDKNSLILGTKLLVLKSFLLRVEREVQFRWEHPLFFVASMLRAS